MPSPKAIRLTTTQKMQFAIWVNSNRERLRGLTRRKVSDIYERELGVAPSLHVVKEVAATVGLELNVNAPAAGFISGDQNSIEQQLQKDISFLLEENAGLKQEMQTCQEKVEKWDPVGRQNNSILDDFADELFTLTQRVDKISEELKAVVKNVATVMDSVVLRFKDGQRPDDAPWLQYVPAERNGE